MSKLIFLFCVLVILVGVTAGLPQPYARAENPACELGEIWDGYACINPCALDETLIDGRCIGFRPVFFPVVFK
jgi:hypothetical protein